MDNISRNDPCPCGSGKKYKKCCGAKEVTPFDGLTPGIRMKGGVCFDETVNGFIPIVHTWDNVLCQGEPEEWRYHKAFPTEEEALQYYKIYIRPVLQRMMAKIESENNRTSVVYRKLE